MLNTNVFATRCAVSLANDFGTTVTPSQTLSGNFTASSAYAQLSYSRISDVHSSRATAFTKSYLTGTATNGDRRMETDIIFLNGHGNSNLIVFCSLGNQNYATGVKSGGDQVVDNFFDCVGLNTLDMSGTTLITYCACNTGSDSSNLLTNSIARGARVAVGFDNTIWSANGSDGEEWLKSYHDMLGSGYYIRTAINWANRSVPTSSLATSVVYEGPAGTVNLNPVSSTNSKLDNLNPNLNNDIINNSFYTKQLNVQYKLENEIIKENLKENEEKFSFIIDEIKKIDDSFDINDYKVTTHLYNEDDGCGYISFNYYLNDNIQTNKVYMANIENNIITELTLAGVKKENLKNIENINNEKIISKVKNNIENKNVSKSINSIFPKYRTENNKKMITEYIYDFNNNTLKKVDKITVTKDNGVILTDSVETII